MSIGQKVKTVLKRIFPPPVNTFYRQTQNITDEITQNSNSTKQEIDKLSRLIDGNFRCTNEVLWAHIFNSTISGSKWLKDTSFSPGRAAIGYPFLYVLYRILNEIHPKRILEMGLGQSTKMIGQFAEYNKASHYVVEHNPQWVDFFKKGFTLSKYTETVVLPTTMESYKNADAIRVYKDFQNTFVGKTFDLVCIDGPLGYDMPLYSRIDILKLLPDCLEHSFVILIDDYQRTGEQNTAREIENKLKLNHIDCSSGVYSGDKDFWLICSSDLAFLCTL